MDLLKLKIIRTDNEVGKWRSYDVIDRPDIEVVLVKADSYPLTLDIIVIEDSSSVSNVCTAKFLELGPYKINIIKLTREATNWGLKESKEFVESFPRTLTVNDNLTSQKLNDLVRGTNDMGGKAEMSFGKQCNDCPLRFRCFTER